MGCASLVSPVFACRTCKTCWETQNGDHSCRLCPRCFDLSPGFWPTTTNFLRQPQTRLQTPTFGVGVCNLVCFCCGCMAVSPNRTNTTHGLPDLIFEPLVLKQGQFRSCMDLFPSLSVCPKKLNRASLYIETWLNDSVSDWVISSPVPVAYHAVSA